MREVCGEHVIVASGRKNIDFCKIINLNETAAVMWMAVLGKDFQAADMAAALTAEYEVDEATALADAERIVKEWSEIGLLEA